MPRRPKLGQHFLASTRYRQRIAQALRLRAEDLVIEIGAGRGAMTGLLAAGGRKVVAVELDAKLAETLEAKLSAHPAVRVLHADILETDIAQVCGESEAKQCYVFGNLPYYITSPILHHLLAARPCVRGMALLMQREVAERVTAQPGGRAYGYLSVACQLFAKARILFHVPPGAFSPPPKVQSALVEFEMGARFPPWSAEEESSFLDFAKFCFAHKRKSLANNLAALVSRPQAEEILASLRMPPKVRAEELPLDKLAALHSALQAGGKS